jgi:hypothetical protein
MLLILVKFNLLLGSYIAFAYLHVYKKNNNKESVNSIRLLACINYDFIYEKINNK